MTERIAPPASEIIQGFTARHSLMTTPLFSEVALAIYWSSVANISLHQGIAGLDSKVFESEPSLGLLLNLLDRCFEHIEGAIVAFVTGSGASCEVVSRASLEGAVTILYILQENRDRRLLAYLRNYVAFADKQVASWKSATTSSVEDCEHHVAAADRRARVTAQFRDIVDRLTDEVSLLGVAGKEEKWPNILGRFRALDGNEVGYRTVYARLCSETHFDAEETLRYFVGTLADEQAFRRMAVETVEFSRFMMFISAEYFIRAVLAYGSAYQISLTTSTLEPGLKIMQSTLEKLAGNLGAYEL